MPALELLEEILLHLDPMAFRSFIKERWQAHLQRTGLDPANQSTPATSSKPVAGALSTSRGGLHPLALRITDQECLQHFIPTDMRRTLLRYPAGIHTLSFALRHQLSNLYLDYLFDKSKAVLLGFNVGGALLIPRNTNHCAYVETSTARQCTHAVADEIFCSKHAPEHWWRWPEKLASSAPQPGASPEAKMFAYYHNLENIDQYSDAELEQMLRWFWKKFRQHQNKQQPVAAPSLQEIAGRLGFSNEAELMQVDRAAVRRAYHRALLSCHPDQGGSLEDFHALQQAYQAWLHFRDHQP